MRHSALHLKFIYVISQVSEREREREGEREKDGGRETQREYHAEPDEFA